MSIASASAAATKAFPSACQETVRAARRLSMNCFFNALIRETDLASWHYDGACPEGVSSPAVCIALASRGEQLWVGARYRSACGRHQFAPEILRVCSDQHSAWIDLAGAAELLAGEPGLFPQADEVGRRQFVERVRMSERNLGLSLLAREAEFDALFRQPLSFIASEQALFVGHSIHPTPKSREPFSDQDAVLYAPEFAQRFALTWLAVRPQNLQGQSSFPVGCQTLMRELMACDAADLNAPEGFTVMPAHPWQWRVLQDSAAVGELLASGDLVVLGEGRPEWSATSSLRAIYAPHSPWMLKFSLSLRLTNSLRTLQPQEMARGLEVSRIRATPMGEAFARRYPNFSVLAEPAYAMLKPTAGEPLAESLVLLRENPFQHQQADNVCLLATLTQDHPYAEPCRAAQLVSQYAQRVGLSIEHACVDWFERLFRVAVEPLIIAQADYGWLYGAHQQNLVIGFDQDLPCAAWFRDCQGSGFSQLGASLLAPYLPELGRETSNVIDDEMANRLFVYYLIVNSTWGLISALAAAGLCPESTLLMHLRAWLDQLRKGPRADTGCLNYILDTPQLWAKGNFQCALIGLNETTTEDPLAIYHRLPNPLIFKKELS